MSKTFSILKFYPLKIFQFKTLVKKTIIKLITPCPYIPESMANDPRSKSRRSRSAEESDEIYLRKKLRPRNFLKIYAASLNLFVNLY